ncbi:MAG: MFS transporter [Candidatus Helarchaeota archaeon]
MNLKSSLNSLTLYLIFFIFFFGQITQVMIIPNQIQYSLYFWPGQPFHALEITMMLAIHSWAFAVSCLIFGILADRYSRKKIVCVTLILSVIGLFIAGFSYSYFQLLLSQILLGFSEGGFIPVAQAIMGDATRKEEKGKVFGSIAVAVYLGYNVGLLYGSILVYIWQFSFLILGFISVFILFLYVFFGVDFRIGSKEKELEQVMVKDMEYGHKFNLESLRVLSKTRSIIFILVEGISSYIMWGLFSTMLFPFLQTGAGRLSSLMASLVMILFSFPATIFGVAFLSRVSDRVAQNKPLNRVRLIIFMLISTFIFMLILIYIPIIPMTESQGRNFFFVFLNPGILMIGGIVAAVTIVGSLWDINQAPIMEMLNLPESRGTTYAINRFLEAIGHGFGPFLAGIFLLLTSGNFQLSMTLGLLFGIPGIVSWFFILLFFDKDRAKISQLMTERAGKILEKNEKKN